MEVNLSKSWRRLLRSALESASFSQLREFVDGERARHDVFPPEAEVFHAFQATEPDAVRVVILGQDPYHDDGQAHGLAFSVRSGMRLPPSLVNIFKELESDLGIPRTSDGNLDPWAKQGVLLLNTVLTVRAHAAHSHQGRGWEAFTDAAIEQLSQHGREKVFVLWGKPAQRKEALIDGDRHLILKSPHPSPLSARRGFFGSRPFSRINDWLTQHGEPIIHWSLNGE